MARVLTNENNYYNIADTIRQMKNVNTTYKPREMASALKDIYSNEVEGTLPLSFEANGNNLLNYRIDGASGGVGDRTNNLFDKKNTEIIHAYFSPENLWQVNEDSSSIIIKVRPNTQYTLSIGTAISIFRIYKTSLENPEPGKSNVFTPIIRSSNINTYTFTTDNDTTYIIFQGTNADTEMWINSLVLNIGSTSLPSYEPYGYKVPVVVSGKNLLQNKATSITLNGVTCTVNDDKSVTFTGSPERSFDLIFNNSLILNPGTYIYTNGLTQSYSRIRVDMYVAGTGGNINYWANPSVTFTTTNTYKFVSRIFIQGNAGELAGLTIYPMVRESSITDDTYEPYHEPTTTNIYLDNPIRTVEDEVEYIDYSEQKHHRVRKNLLQNTATTQTINGVNVIVNNDGSIKLSGTSTAITYIDINSNFNSTEFQDCYLNPFYPNNFVSSASTVLLRISNTTNRNSIQDFLNNSVIRDNGSNLRLAIRIGQNYTFSNNFVISPMISKFSDNTYEPYIENTEVDVTLPAIPTLDGTNTLSIGTTVQPSNVYVQAPKDSIEATQIASELEEI